MSRWWGIWAEQWTEWRVWWWLWRVYGFYWWNGGGRGESGIRCEGGVPGNDGDFRAWSWGGNWKFQKKETWSQTGCQIKE